MKKISKYPPYPPQPASFKGSLPRWQKHCREEEAKTFRMAIAPHDYKGKQADWCVELQKRGLWNGQGYHGDVLIPEEDWWSILEYCEAKTEGGNK